jgi:regulator of vacuolar morphogenesis
VAVSAAKRTMSGIQAIFVRGHELRQNPKPHTIYRIEIQGVVRAWQIWRRYSEFVDLDDELQKDTSSDPPAPLPPKHAFSFSSLTFRKNVDDEALIKERVEGLEKYLRAIVASKDDKWRESFAFKEFLSMPIGKGGISSTDDTKGGSASLNTFTSASWLDEQSDLQGVVRDIRADLNKRDALADRADVTGSHTSGLEAKKKLAALITRVGILEKGLEQLGLGGLSGGELTRRRDMVARLRDDCEKLGKIVVAARQNTRAFAPGSLAERQPASQADRNSLLGAPQPPVARVFGAPQETAETRPLDDVGILQLQSLKIDNQDSQLNQLSAVLRRQKGIGLAIGNEIEEQNTMLDHLNEDIDRVSGKLGAARKQMKRLE